MGVGRGVALVGALGVVAATVACTPTELAAAACIGRDVVAAVADPPRLQSVAYEPSVAEVPDGAGVDASGATWRIPEQGLTSRDGSLRGWAVNFREMAPAHSDVCFVGGTILDDLPHATTTWEGWHARGAALAARAPRLEVVGTRLFNVGDGIAFTQPGSEGWALRGVHIRYAHDDCVEDDWLHGGTIEDSFLDGCFIAISAKATPASLAAGSDGTGDAIVVRDSIVRLHPMPHVYNPDHFLAPGHGAFYKAGAVPADGRSPRLEVHGSTFVLSQHPSIRRSHPWVHDDPFPTFDPDGGGPRPPEPYLDPADCSDNRLLWLADSDPDLGGVPPCFTVLTGASARDAWAAERDAWLEAHPYAW